MTRLEDHLQDLLNRKTAIEKEGKLAMGRLGGLKISTESLQAALREVRPRLPSAQADPKFSSKAPQKNLLDTNAWHRDCEVEILLTYMSCLPLEDH